MRSFLQKAGHQSIENFSHKNKALERAATIRVLIKTGLLSRNKKATTKLTRAMTKEISDHTVFLFILIVILPANSSSAKCVGRFVNPITDICWKCIFPLRIAGIPVASGRPDPDTSPLTPICTCLRGIKSRVGFPISFWEPARLVDVTRTPYCMVGLGGLSLTDSGAIGRGDVETDTDDQTEKRFYQVHWYFYPVFYLLQVLIDFACGESRDFDLGWITEIDPFWADDEKAAILNPEGILFGNPIAQAACAADGIAATAHLPLDELFWCGGCLGSLYPFGGTVSGSYGGVQASSLMAARFMASLHRKGLMKEHAGSDALCAPHIQPILQKSHYRLQMTYPVPQTNDCKTLGHTDITWNMGKEFPYEGEDFGYLVFRKKDCCLGVGIPG
jgi:conjugal transfer pilus assembly protein TraU